MGPPRPRLVLRIGVSGHRPDKFDGTAQALVAQKLHKFLADVAAALARLQEREREFLDDAKPEIRIVSALAEGADSVVAKVGLAAGATLDVILPFPETTYLNDFKDDGARTTFNGLLKLAKACFVLPGENDGEEGVQTKRAYEAVGLMTVRQCDMLITIWNGQTASGRGGTAIVVQHAISTGRPVLWFDEHGNGPHLLRANSMEPADASDLAASAAEQPIADAETAERIVRHLCAPPTAEKDADKHQKKTIDKARMQLGQFFTETERHAPWWAFGYPLLLTIFAFKGGFWKSFRHRPFLEATKANWSAFRTALDPAGPSVTGPIDTILMPRFAWTDGLADRYGRLHRGGYVSNFTLAAFAILFASLSWSDRPNIALFELAEFIAIVAIVVATTLGWWNRWHERWVDYRQLSGQLRHLRSLTLTGSSSWETHTPHAGEELEPGPRWVNWYLRMTAREIGLVGACADRAYVETARAAIRTGEVENQIDYHSGNARTMKRVGFSLEVVGVCAFVATLITCGFEVAHLVPCLLDPPAWADQYLRVLPVVLPAFGAALFGIRVHGDFEGSAERSDDMVRRLRGVLARLKDVKKMSFAELSALTEYAALVMANEAGDWGFVYRGRPLALPT